MSIRKLREAVEAGTWPADFRAADIGVYGVTTMSMYEAFSGSLDAALALMQAMLPGWMVAGIHQQDNGSWWCELREGYITSYSRVVIAPDNFSADTPARALLLAILKAKEATDERL